MLRARSTAAEWMDDAAATRPDFEAALRDLARINRMSLAHPPVLRWLDGMVARSGAQHLSILDVGAGGGDLLAAIAAWGARRGIALDLTGLDRSAGSPPTCSRWTLSSASTSCCAACSRIT